MTDPLAALARDNQHTAGDDSTEWLRASTSAADTRCPDCPVQAYPVPAAGTRWGVEISHAPDCPTGGERTVPTVWVTDADYPEADNL